MVNDRENYQLGFREKKKKKNREREKKPPDLRNGKVVK